VLRDHYSKNRGIYIFKKKKIINVTMGASLNKILEHICKYFLRDIF
jgi:hypothetical protein